MRKRDRIKCVINKKHTPNVVVGLFYLFNDASLTIFWKIYTKQKIIYIYIFLMHSEKNNNAILLKKSPETIIREEETRL